MPRADTIPAVEVKLTRAVESTHMRHLRWLKRIIGDELVDPVVINTGNAVYCEPRGGIAVVPLGLLGPKKIVCRIYFPSSRVTLSKIAGTGLTP
jgi:hypothetical protein